MLYLIYLLILGSVALIAIGFILPAKPAPRPLSALMQSNNDSARQELLNRPIWLRLFKFLMPLNKIIADRLGRAKLENKIMAGRLKLLPEEFLLAMEISSVLFLGLANLVLKDILTRAGVLGVVICIAFPFIAFDFWLRARIGKRRRRVVVALPDVVDLLSLCVNAGLDFGTAIRWIVDKSRPTPVVDELKLLLFEISVGKTHRQALEDMAKRLDVPEVHSFSRTLIQAERLGSPVGAALNILSEEMREYTFRRREKQALQAPIKMLFPLVFFIMPVVLLIVGGPIMLQFMQGGFQLFK
jgi:tight adherence protein C